MCNTTDLVDLDMDLKNIKWFLGVRDYRLRWIQVQVVFIERQADKTINHCKANSKTENWQWSGDQHKLNKSKT